MKIDVNMNEITSVEKIVSEVLFENDFNKMNYLVNQSAKNNKFLFPSSILNGQNSLISFQRQTLKPFVKIISESEFYKIVGAGKRGLSKKSGRYQEYLYGHYLEAVKQCDEGYISDVLYKALEFKTNLKYVKSLMRKKSFAEEWRRNFKVETAEEVFKRKGDLRIVDIIKERAK